jgi:hypothetical protein
MHFQITIGSKKKSKEKLKIQEKQKYNIPKLIGYSKSKMKGEIYEDKYIF